MAHSLTKSFARMVAHDDPAALLSALPEGFDPFDFHLQGDLLPLRCAMYGAARCLVELARARPGQAEAIFSIHDGNGERAVDWCSSWADPSMVKDIIALAPAACSTSGSAGHWPLARALSMGQWDSASLWLDQAPASALVLGGGGRTALHFCAEPGFDFLNERPSSEWAAPPASLVSRIIDLGVDPCARNAKGFSALARSVASGSRAGFDAILRACPKPKLAELLSRQDAPFNPGHEAVWRAQPGMLNELVEHGLDLFESTDKKFGLMHLAIRQDSFECAEALFALRAQNPSIFEPSDTSTSCPVSAMGSKNPERWIQWLEAHGADLDARDDYGAHYAELAWEKSSFAQARALWVRLAGGAPRRDALSLFSALERGARSAIEPAEKILFLLSHGFLPAKLDIRDALAKKIHDPREQLDSMEPTALHSNSFGIYRHLELGPLWDTEPDTGLSMSAKTSQAELSAVDTFDLFYSSASRKTPDPSYKRPSLLAYCASRNLLASLNALLSWDALGRHFNPVDYLCAWRESLKADANLPILRALKSALGSLGLDLWGPKETRLAFERLGPAKARELGAPIPSSGDGFGRWLNAKNLAEAFLLNSDFFSKNTVPLSADPKQVSDGDALARPWRTAAKSVHDGAIKRLLPPEAPWPAICSLHAALACSSEGKGSLVLWIAKNLRDQARHAPPESPWGTSPELALPHWDAQIRFELGQARRSFPKDGARSGAFLPEGAASSLLLATLLESAQEACAEELLRSGLQAPADFTRIANAIGTRADKATAIGSDNQDLERIRSFCETLCQRPDFVSILDTASTPILSRLPDPALFDAFFNAGASTGSGSDNVFIQLCKRHASRLTPAFAERLAERCRALEPSMPLAVASALASMKPHASRSSLDFAPTAAARLRVERSAKGVDEAGWVGSYDQGFCPVGSALEASNVALALSLAEQSPQGYVAKAKTQWMAQWLKARAPSIGAALLVLSTPDAKDPKLAQARSALDTMADELSRLRALGACFNTSPEQESAHAAHGLQKSIHKIGMLSWLLDQGFEPRALCEAHFLDYSSSRKLLKLFDSNDGLVPAKVPLLCAAFGDESPPDAIVKLCLLWSALGLPERLGEPPIEGSPSLQVHALLAPQVASAYESALLSAALLADPVARKTRARL